MVETVRGIWSEEGYIPILPHNHLHQKNAFTVIVGKNGVGKSRLLHDIAKPQLWSAEPDYFGVASEYPKVIAVSTSPFDKFPPISRRAKHGVTNYRYIGIRHELFAHTSAVSLISSAARGLLSKFASTSELQGLQAVFDTIGCHSACEFVLKPSYRALRSPSPYPPEDLHKDLRAIHMYLGEIDSRLWSEIQALGPKKRRMLLGAVKLLLTPLKEQRAITIALDFESGLSMVDDHQFGKARVAALLLLVEAGFMRLMDLRLQKKGLGPMSVRRASSGEQCILVMMLGIAGHISDGSLILIDEPEISLHPEWQERFISLLKESFQHYRECQFIIATHSPQIVARLEDDDSFILSLSTKELHSSSGFSNRSADYQLAELFDAPGMRNEYISRIAFNLLAKVKARKSVTRTDREQLSHLKRLTSKVIGSDPVVDLVNSVEEVCSFYEDK